MLQDTKKYLLIGCLAWVVMAWAVACGGPTSGVYVDVPDFERGATMTHSGGRVGICAGTSGVGCGEAERSGKHCKNNKGPADVIVVDGKVVRVVCYGEPKGKVIVDGEFGKIEKQDVLVTFAPGTRDFKGKVDVKGDRAVIFGNGPERTIIHGEVHLHGHDCRLRGVTIHGKLKLHGDRCSAISVVVHGKLEVHGHDVVLSNVIALDDLKSKDDRLTAFRLFVDGKLDIKKKDHTCVDSFFFADRNDNGLVEPTELGDTLCGEL